MTSQTLTSLAILRVNVDHGRDYLDYLRLFVLEVLVDCTFNSPTTNYVKNKIEEQFGLVIPSRSVDIVLRRLTREFSGSLKRDKDKYRITGDLTNPGIAVKRVITDRHITAVLYGLIDFSTETSLPITSEAQANEAVCAFLARFDIECLRANIRGTAIPNVDGRADSYVTLVANYVRELKRTDPERFDSFSMLVQGHMLANALICPDLKDAPKTYRKLTLYLDTPLLVQLLGYEGLQKQEAVRELIALVSHSGGRFTTFYHSRIELRNVLTAAANNLSRFTVQTGIVREARRKGITRSDLLIQANTVETNLRKFGIDIVRAPHYSEDLDTQTRRFELILDDELSYQTITTKDLDVHSVRSIYKLRKNRPAPSFEEATAVLVTSNTRLAKAASRFAREYNTLDGTPSVVTDFALANAAWLKTPLESSTIPDTQLAALAYAALQPSDALLEKYLDEIEKLEARGDVEISELQLLRGSPLAYEELMHYTLGNTDVVTEDLLPRIVDRIHSRIRRRESGRVRDEYAERLIAAEERGRQETRMAIQSERARHLQRESVLKDEVQRLRDERDKAKERLSGEQSDSYRRRATRWVNGGLVSIIILLMIAIAITYEDLLWPNAVVGVNGVLPPVVVLASIGVLVVVTIANLVFGSTVMGWYRTAVSVLANFLIRRDNASKNTRYP